MDMKKNIGKMDRVIRIVAGIAVAAAGYVYGIWWLYIIAAIFLATAMIGWCGLYTLLGVKTR
jgi:hypothetical protein